MATPLRRTLVSRDGRVLVASSRLLPLAARDPRRRRPALRRVETILGRGGPAAAVPVPANPGGGVLASGVDGAISRPARPGRGSIGAMGLRSPSSSSPSRARRSPTSRWPASRARPANQGRICDRGPMGVVAPSELFLRVAGLAHLSDHGDRVRVIRPVGSRSPDRWSSTLAAGSRIGRAAARSASEPLAADGIRRLRRKVSAFWPRPPRRHARSRSPNESEIAAGRGYSRQQGSPGHVDDGERHRPMPQGRLVGEVVSGVRAEAVDRAAAHRLGQGRRRTDRRTTRPPT